MLMLMFLLLVSAPACEREPMPMPTRAEIMVWNRDGAKVRSAVLKGRELDALTRLVRDPASYDREKQAACFEPRHEVTLYYRDSVLDTFEICFSCHNIAVSASNPWVGCEPDPSLPKQMSLKPEAYEAIKNIFVRAKVKHMPSNDKN